MGWRRTITAGVGIVAVLLGILVLAVPGVSNVRTIAALSSAIESLDPVTLMVFGSITIGAYLLVAGRNNGQAGRDSTAERRFDRAVEFPPEAVTADRQVIAGNSVDAELELALQSGETELQRVRSLLRETATTVYAKHTDSEQEDASEVVDRGEWTSDETAAWFVAGPGGPEPPLRARLRLWLQPERERRRRIECVVDELEKLQSES